MSTTHIEEQKKKKIYSGVCLRNEGQSLNSRQHKNNMGEYPQ